MTKAASPVPKPLGNLPGGLCRQPVRDAPPAGQRRLHTSDRPVELVCSNSISSTLPDQALASSSKRCSTWAASSFAPPFRHALPAEAPWLSAATTSPPRSPQPSADTPTSRSRVARCCFADILDGLAIIATGPPGAPATNLDEPHRAPTGQHGTSTCATSRAPSSSPWIASTCPSPSDRSAADRNSEPGQEQGDYINCPLSRRVRSLRRRCWRPRASHSRSLNKSQSVTLKAACPSRSRAGRDLNRAAYGPLRRLVGLRDLRTGRRPMLWFNCARTVAAATL